MRTVLSIIIIFLFSCRNHEEQKPVQPIKISYKGELPDSFNIIDSKGRKQGIWIEEHTQDTVVYLNDTVYLIRGTTAHELLQFLQRKRRGHRDTLNIILKPDTFRMTDTRTIR